MKICHTKWKRLGILLLVMTMLLNTVTVFASDPDEKQESAAQETNSEEISTEEAVTEKLFIEPDLLESSDSGFVEDSLEETNLEIIEPKKTGGSEDESSSDEDTEEVPTVSYQTHVQTFGWQDWSSNGAENGTTGLAKRLEGIRIKIENTDLEGSICYQTHVQSFGWQNEVSDGALSGTTGLAKRLEGIKIWLTGELAEKYDVYYRVHAQSFGWLDWAANGEMAGSSGLAKRLESIQIVLVKKDDPAPGKTDRASVSLPGVSYKTHVQTYGWQDWVADGVTSGLAGQNKRMESLAIELTGDTNLSGSIEYRTHVQSFGWQDWSKDGALNGTEGLAKRVEALQIRLTGEVAAVCDVYYRVYVEGYGWLGWAKNGEMAGTSGLALRVEAIQIRIGAKSGSAPVIVGETAYHAYTGPGYYQIGNQRYYYAANGVRRSGTGWITQNGKRYYLIDGAYATGWKYIGGYKYYFNSDGSLCQNVDNIIGVQSSYLIKVNKEANCVTIYASDGANGYIIPVKAMLCSTGDDTPLGTRKTLGKYRWRGMFNGTYAQYATRLTAAPGVLFHSITYETTNNRTMIAYGYNGLGTVRSAGCIRLVCGDAYWIYSRCAVGTTVTVYNDPNPGPFDRPTITPIPDTQTWDPTDPNL